MCGQSCEHVYHLVTTSLLFTPFWIAAPLPFVRLRVHCTSCHLAVARCMSSCLQPLNSSIAPLYTRSLHIVIPRSSASYRHSDQNSTRARGLSSLGLPSARVNLYAHGLRTTNFLIAAHVQDVSTPPIQYRSSDCIVFTNLGERAPLDALTPLVSESWQTWYRATLTFSYTATETRALYPICARSMLTKSTEDSRATGSEHQFHQNVVAGGLETSSCIVALSHSFVIVSNMPNEHVRIAAEVNAHARSPSHIHD